MSAETAISLSVLHAKKADEPISVTLAGTVTPVSHVQHPQARYAMDVTLAGIVKRPENAPGQVISVARKILGSVP